MFDLDSIRAQSRQAAQELLAAAHLTPGKYAKEYQSGDQVLIQGELRQ